MFLASLPHLGPCSLPSLRCCLVFIYFFFIICVVCCCTLFLCPGHTHTHSYHHPPPPVTFCACFAHPPLCVITPPLSKRCRSSDSATASAALRGGRPSSAPSSAPSGRQPLTTTKILIGSIGLQLTSSTLTLH